jgi:hypothetical protein
LHLAFHLTLREQELAFPSEIFLIVATDESVSLEFVDRAYPSSNLVLMKHGDEFRSMKEIWWFSFIHVSHVRERRDQSDDALSIARR